MNMQAEERYKGLFPDDEDGRKRKAKAFDMLADAYYMGNFGSMQKSDIDLIMFSNYLEAVLDQCGNDSAQCSDYNLSKYLGITQNRIRTLKERKQLKYPYERFDWKKSFLEICKNARYSDGKIIINIMDVNVYLELKNAIESAGGYVDTQISQSTLKIRLEYFVDLMMLLCEENDRRKVQKEMKEYLRKEDIDVAKFEEEGFGTTVFNCAKSKAIDVCCDALNKVCPLLGELAKPVINKVVDMVRKNK